MNSYRGVCLLGVKAKNLVADVKVKDTAGLSITLTLAEYVRRAVKPEYKTLPWCEDQAPPGAARSAGRLS
jgi:hypothetical protein